MTDYIDAVITKLEAGQTVALATIVGPPEAAATVGRKLVVAQNGEVQGTLGMTSVDRRAASEASTILSEAPIPRLATLSLSGEEQEGLGTATPELELFLELLVPAPTLLVAGGGHIAIPLCAMGKALDFRVVIVDDRPEFANRRRFPEADQVIAGSFGEELSRLPINASTYVVIVTRGHSNDEESLRTALESRAAYIGMIGSSRKVKTIMDRLRESGVPQERLGQVYSPIGLDIAAKTPAEIALSILAEIVHVRRCGNPHTASMKLAVKKSG